MKIDMYVLCPKCNKRLKLKTVGWNSKPTCESCLSSFEILVNSEEMKLTFTEIDYLK